MRGDILQRIYDANRYSDPALTSQGCYRCQFYTECLRNLYTLFWVGDHYAYIPLRCFAEHPDYDPSLWKMRG